MMFKTLMEAGYRDGAEALARTYEPAELAKLPVIGIEPQPDEARRLRSVATDIELTLEAAD